MHVIISAKILGVGIDLYKNYVLIILKEKFSLKNNWFNIAKELSEKGVRNYKIDNSENEFFE